MKVKDVCPYWLDQMVSCRPAYPEGVCNKELNQFFKRQQMLLSVLRRREVRDG